MKIHYFKRVWDSPTITSWGAQSAQALKLLLVTPLLLRNFSEVEIAAWLLFASINYFGGVFVEKSTLILTRMVALASGGGVKAQKQSESEESADSHDATPSQFKKPSENWSEISAIYATSGTLCIFASVLFLAAGAAIGYFSLTPLIFDYSDSTRVWAAFIVILLGDACVKVFQRYLVLLRGLNRVSMVNRWNTLFAVISILCASLALSLGADIFQLALVIQVIGVIGIVRFFFLIRYASVPEIRTLKPYGWDREIAAAAIGPLIKSAATNLATQGSSRFAIIMLARTLPPAPLAGVLLSLRLLDAFSSISQAPVGSHMPSLARLYRQGEQKKFQTNFVRCIRLANWLLAAAIIALVALGAPVLSFIGSNVSLLEPLELALLALGFFWLYFIKIALSVPATINEYPAVNRMVVSGVLVAILSAIFIPHYGIPGYLAAAYLPFALVLFSKPWFEGGKVFKVSAIRFFGLCFFPSLVGLVVLLSVSLGVLYYVF